MGFDIEAAAALLIDARRRFRQVRPLAEVPTLEQAYAVQDAVAAQLGPAGGWKGGAPSPEAEPTAAPLPAALMRESPCDWPAAGLHMIGIEAEIAFRLGREVAAGEPLDEAAALAAVASAHAAIEIVDTRLQGWGDADRMWLVADASSNGGFVYEPRGVPLAGQDLARAQVRLVIDGRVAVERQGGNAGGDPRRIAAGLIRHAAARRGGLKAGMMVTTGSFTGIVFVAAGAAVTAEFPGLGAASVRFT